MRSAGKALIVLTAGGTGGHMFPADALAGALIGEGCRVALVTDRRGGAYGKTLKNIETHKLRAGQVTGRGPIARLLGLADIALGTLQARSLLKRLKPAVVVGFGGYASFPAMIAAGWLGIPAALHEQNAVLGRANRFLARYAACIAVAYSDVRGVRPVDAGKLVVTGNPVRAPIAALAGAPYPGIAKGKPVNLLILGGSQGARIFSEIVPAAAALLSPSLRKRLRIAQQCREEDLEGALRVYTEAGLKPELASFFDDVPKRLKAASLLICRAGASTIAELTAAGRPAILVPYPHATDDHQSANARAVARAGAGWLAPQPQFTAAWLAQRMAELLDRPAELATAARQARKMGRPDAAEHLAKMVLSLVPAPADHAGSAA